MKEFEFKIILKRNSVAMLVPLVKFLITNLALIGFVLSLESNRSFIIQNDMFIKVSHFDHLRVLKIIIM